MNPLLPSESYYESSNTSLFTESHFLTEEGYLESEMQDSIYPDSTLNLHKFDHNIVYNLGNLIVHLHKSEEKFERLKEQLITQCPDFSTRAAFKTLFSFQTVGISHLL